MTSFTFTEENLKEAQACLAKYPKGRERSALIPLLDLAQRQCGGWLPPQALEGVAHFLGLPPIKVLEVASFYSLFNLKPVGKYHIQLCGTPPCWLCGAGQIRQACEDYLGIQVGQTTPDHLFTLSEVECLGACVNAPVVQINDTYYEDLTPQTVVALLKAYQEGTPPPGGSLLGRQDTSPSPLSEERWKEEEHAG